VGEIEKKTKNKRKIKEKTKEETKTKEKMKTKRKISCKTGTGAEIEQDLRYANPPPITSAVAISRYQSSTEGDNKFCH
jgi:hypothetical protein